MISIPCSRMSGAGNTFVMVDGRLIPAQADLVELARASTRSREGSAGSDGFIAIYPPDAGTGADFTMRYYNRDGSTGMMCGNGGRCAVRFAIDHGFASDGGTIRFSNAGVDYTAAVTPRGVSVSFPDPLRIDLGEELELMGAPRRFHFADVGTPHAVFFIDELGAPGVTHVGDLDVDAWGAPVRFHERFAPAGVNANFVEVLPEGGIRLRTFERGVDAETGACGTGAISSAIIAALTRGFTPPVAVTTTSGATLWVHFHRDAMRGITGVSLEGGAEVVAEETLDLRS